MSWLSNIHNKRTTAKEKIEQKKSQIDQARQNVESLAQKIAPLIRESLIEFCREVMLYDNVEIIDRQGISYNCWQWVVPAQGWLPGPPDTPFGEHWWRIRISAIQHKTGQGSFKITLEVTDAVPTNIYRTKSFSDFTKNLSKEELQRVLYHIAEEYLDLVFPE
jgi:hypothetical protein